MKKNLFLPIILITNMGTGHASHSDTDSIYKKLNTQHAFEEEKTNFLLQSRNFIVISLGSDCHPALYTRQHNIRSYAFPFDWCFSPFDGVYTYIQNDFKDYFTRENLVPDPDTCINTTFIDIRSGIRYNHDFAQIDPDYFTKNYLANYKKYMRRVNRFYQQIISGRYVYFIRHRHTTKAEAEKLHELLKTKFPFTRFVLIVIGNQAEFAMDWNIPGIKNYYSEPYNSSFWEQLCNNILSGTL